jgi:hypothetical protein
VNQIDIARAKRQEVRAHLLKVLDRQRPNPTAEAIILRSLSQSGITLKQEELLQELAYLEAKELATHAERLWSLCPLGVDVLEHNVEAPAGIPVNGQLSPEVLAYRKEVRGRILTALYFARPHGTSSAILWRALDDSDLSVSDKELSREAQYLAGKGLIATEGGIAAAWAATLTAEGQDVLEGSSPAPAGVHLIEWEG